jgi:hypothetical protein
MGHGCHDCGCPNGCECVPKLNTPEPKEFRMRCSRGTCKDHRRYQGKRKPRLPCEQCWRIFFYVKGEIL